MGHGMEESHLSQGGGEQVNQRQSEARTKSTSGVRRNGCEKENRKSNLKIATLRHEYSDLDASQ